MVSEVTSVALTLELEPITQARLETRAKEAGLRLEAFVESLVRGALPPVSVEEAIALYDAEAVTQGQAAHLAGLSRRAFLDTLAAAGVSAAQYTPEEAIQEAFRE